jgi:hypothetical protein
MTPAEILADYESASARGLELLAAVQSQDVELPLGDVGTYPASVVPTAYAFEHYVHIRYDLFAPDGPFSGEPPASDELRLGPTLDWIEAALPQQNSELLGGMDKAVEVRLSGVDGRPYKSAMAMWPARSTVMQRRSSVGSLNEAAGNPLASTHKATRPPSRSFGN